MGIRSNNVLIIRAEHKLSPDAQRYLADSLVDTNAEGSLYAWESNFTPMWARDGQGQNCVNDLLEEAAIHTFLGTLPSQDFYMKRAGEECASRGEWELHSFRQDETVISVERQYMELVNDAHDSQPVSSERG